MTAWFLDHAPGTRPTQSQNLKIETRNSQLNYRVIEGITTAVSIVKNTLISHTIAHIESELGRWAHERGALVVLACMEEETDQFVYALNLRIKDHFGHMIIRNQLDGVDACFNKSEEDLVEACVEVSAIHSYVIINTTAYKPHTYKFKKTEKKKIIKCL